NDAISTLKSQRVRSGHGSWYVRGLYPIVVTHLESTTKIIFETLEANLVGSYKLPALHDTLTNEFDTHFNTQVQVLSRVLESEKGKDTLYFSNFNLNEPRGRLIREYHAQINLLCRKLSTEENKPHQTVM